jgi:5-methylcytosine-specific restriction endonuclease McrA
MTMPARRVQRDRILTMPSRPPKPCSYPGCRTLITSGARCEKHQAAQHSQYDQGRRRDDPALAMAKRIRDSSQWQKVRELFRARNPLCCDPFGEHGNNIESTEHVHHIQGLIVRPDLAYEWSNLAGLCAACHSRIESLERTGNGTQSLFAANATKPPQ